MKIWSVVPVFVLGIFVSGEAAAAAQTRQQIQVSVQRANVRDAPSLQGEIIFQVSQGEMLWVIQKEGGWYFAESASGRKGYISSTVVRLVESGLELSVSVQPLANPQASRDGVFRNSDVIAMAQVGLNDDIIITAIQQSDSTEFDLSPDGVIALKEAGVSEVVIQFLINRGITQSGSAVSSEASVLPAPQPRAVPEPPERAGETVQPAMIVIPGPRAKPYRVGIKLGASLATLSLPDISEDFMGITMSRTQSRRSAPYVGGFLVLPLTEQSELQVEGAFLGKGGRFEYRTYFLGDDVPSRDDELIKLGYFQIASLLSIRVAGNGIVPYLIGGPSIGFLYRERAEHHRDGDLEYISSVDEDIHDLDLGLMIGGGVHLPATFGRVSVEGRYSFGVIDIVTPSSRLDLNDKFRTREFQIIMAVSFPFGR